MNVDDWGDRFESRPASTVLRFLLTAVGIIFIVSMAIWGIGLLTYAPQQAARIATKTFDADNVIYNYEWFHRQYQDIGAMTPKLDNAQAQLKAFEDTAGPHPTWSFDDKQEHARLSSIVLGLQNQRASMVAEYNAHASMSNREIFIGKSLPNHVD